MVRAANGYENLLMAASNIPLVLVEIKKWDTVPRRFAPLNPVSVHWVGTQTWETANLDSEDRSRSRRTRSVPTFGPDLQLQPRCGPNLQV